MSGLAWLVMACAGMERRLIGCCRFCWCTVPSGPCTMQIFSREFNSRQFFFYPLPQGISWRCIRTLNNFQHLRAGGFRTFTLCNKQVNAQIMYVCTLHVTWRHLLPTIRAVPTMRVLPHQDSIFLVLVLLSQWSVSMSWSTAEPPPRDRTIVPNKSHIAVFSSIGHSLSQQKVRQTLFDANIKPSDFTLFHNSVTEINTARICASTAGRVFWPLRNDWKNLVRQWSRVHCPKALGWLQRCHLSDIKWCW